MAHTDELLRSRAYQRYGYLHRMTSGEVLETKRAATRDSTGNEQDGDDSLDGSEEHHHTSEDGEDAGTQTEEKIEK